MAVIRLLQITDTHLVGDPLGQMRGGRTLDTLRLNMENKRIEKKK